MVLRKAELPGLVVLYGGAFQKSLPAQTAPKTLIITAI